MLLNYILNLSLKTGSRQREVQRSGEKKGKEKIPTSCLLLVGGDVDPGVGAGSAL